MASDPTGLSAEYKQRCPCGETTSMASNYCPACGAELEVTDGN